MPKNYDLALNFLIRTFECNSSLYVAQKTSLKTSLVQDIKIKGNTEKETLILMLVAFIPKMFLMTSRKVRLSSLKKLILLQALFFLILLFHSSD